MLVAYVSGHGFGHFVRASAVLSLLRGVKTHLRTNGRAIFLASRADQLGQAPRHSLGAAASPRSARLADWAASITEVDVGPGVVQRGPLASDLDATRRALAQHLQAWPRLVAEEAAFLRDSGARLVFGDVPPLAFAAAAEAGIPSVALANFSWSWIYQGYAATDPWFAGAADRMREAEAQATLLLALEMGGGLDHFPRRRPIAPVARTVTRSPESVRAALGLEIARTFVLFSLGGFGDDFEVALGAAGRHQVVATSVKMTHPPAGVKLAGDEIPHHELVAAADCLIGKPGYGTVAECLHRPTPLCWLLRSDFREGTPLAESIERWLPNARLSLDDLASGRWAEKVDGAMASRPREPSPLPNGAVEAAAILQEMLASQGGTR